MDFKLTKQRLCPDSSCREAVTQQSVATEITLPDYCGDIKRILKCSLRPGVTNVSLSGDNAFAVGRADINVIYLSEKDKLDCCETVVEFNATARIGDTSGEGFVLCEAKTNYVNCRAVSQRRLSIEGSLAVRFTAVSEEEKELVCDADGSGIQCRKIGAAYEKLLCRREKLFDMGETARVPEDKPPVGKILRVSATVAEENLKAVTDKLLIKAQVTVETVYLSEEENPEVESFVHTMPLSQIADMPGADENSVCKADMRVYSVTATVKSDSSAQGRLVEIAAKVSADISCTAHEEISLIDDCYSTSHIIKPEYCLEQLKLPFMKIHEEKSFTFSAELPSEVGRVLDICCSDTSHSFSHKGSQALLSLKTTAELLYTDGRGIPQWLQKNAEFEISLPLNESHDLLKCSLSAKVIKTDYKIMDKNKLDIIVVFSLDGCIYACESYRAIKNIEVSAEKKPEDDEAALTLYFSEEGESLWDIAKLYNTTKEAITAENPGLTADPTCRLLLIPSYS